MRDGGQESQRVVIFGQGYVGLPLSIGAHSAGHYVVGYDVSRERIQQLRIGQSYVEDIQNDDLQQALSSGRFTPTTDLEDCKGANLFVITVPTPLRDGVPDLTCIHDAASTIGRILEVGATVILESTTYPGTTDELLLPLLEEHSGLIAGKDFFLGYSPERIDPGNPRWGLRNTPKVVSGIDEQSLRIVKAFYGGFVENVVAVSNPRVAEMTKLLENTFRHVNIALVNELAMFAADLNVDLWEALSAADTKPFGFMRFNPGPGVGGHCLPVDPSYLSWKVKQTLGRPFRFVDLANDINDHMPRYVASRVNHILNRERIALNGSRILVLGLSYKRNTGDSRESPIPVLCDILAQQGADIRVSDPYVRPTSFPPHLTRVEASPAEVADADVVVVAVDHDCFDWESITSTARRILDTRHCVSPGLNVEFL